MLRLNSARLSAVLRSWGFWVCGAAAFLVLALAFQIPYTYTVDFGTRSDRFEIVYGLHNEEEIEETFRWTNQNALLQFPALTAGSYELTLRVNGWQPDKPAVLQIQAGESVFNRQTNGDWQDLNLSFAAPAGDLPLAFYSRTFSPADYGNADRRDLGVRLDTLRLAPVRTGINVPPLSHIVPMVLAVMLSYLCVSLLGLRRIAAAAFAGLMVAGWVVLVASSRMYATSAFLWMLVLAMTLGLLVLLFGLDLLNGIYRRVGVTVDSKTLNWLGVTVVGLGILKLVGSSYPNAYIIDQFFHLHRFEFVEQGNLFFAWRAREFGGLETVYPPAFYVFLSPLGTLLGDDLALLHIAVPLVEIFGALVLFAVARLSGLTERAALLATVVYMGAPIAFIVFGWGVYANIFAQQVLLVMLAVWFWSRWKDKPLLFGALLTFVLVFGILAHASMLLMLTFFWGLVLGISWLVRRSERRHSFLGMVSLGVALLIAFVVYFSFFVDKTLANLGSITDRAAVQSVSFERLVGGGLAEEGLGLVPLRVYSPTDWVIQSAIYLARETWVYFRVIPVLLALLALVVIWREPGLRDLAIILGIGFITVLAFFFVGMFTGLYTRYMMFGAPFIALGAGFVLDRLAQGGTFGRVAVAATLLLVLISGIGYWMTRVVY